MTLDKFFDDINEADLRQLVGKKVSGCKTIEYRQCLPDDTFDSQIEFLAEVSSFANTAGGYLVYGVKEQNGIPVALPGIPGKDLEREIIRLDKLLRDHIQPACQQVLIRVVDMCSSDPILLIRIPESWSKPHAVDFQGHWRFYARNSLGKYALNVRELKSAFLTTAGLGERIRSFHFERLNKISAGEIPVSLLGKARTVFHLMPYAAFDSGSCLSFSTIEDIWSIPLMSASTSSYRYNLEGLMVYQERGEAGCSEGYTQVFRNGIIESVNANLLGSSVEGPYVPRMAFERDMTAFLDACLAFFKRLSIHMPAVLFVSLIGIQDCKLTAHRYRDTWHSNINRVDRDWFVLPEVTVESLAVHSAAVLKPILEAAWTSLGWERLYEYEGVEKHSLPSPIEKIAGRPVNISLETKANGH